MQLSDAAPPRVFPARSRIKTSARRRRARPAPPPARPWQPWKSFGLIGGALVAAIVIATTGLLETLRWSPTLAAPAFAVSSSAKRPHRIVHEPVP